ncbi:MAG: hypothetical protein IJQ81_18630 [Oscillibacter sp.]|nr:hypothetical protein [Oscillibacter sp.]
MKAWIRCHYGSTNNRYQTANVTLDVVTARDADTHITDAAARVRHSIATRRHEVVRGYATAIRIRTTATNPRT